MFKFCLKIERTEELFPKINAVKNFVKSITRMSQKREEF